jgi:hypothetical protein
MTILSIHSVFQGDGQARKGDKVLWECTFYNGFSAKARESGTNVAL